MALVRPEVAQIRRARTWGQEESNDRALTLAYVRIFYLLLDRRGLWDEAVAWSERGSAIEGPMKQDLMWQHSPVRRIKLDDSQLVTIVVHVCHKGLLIRWNPDIAEIFQKLMLIHS